MKRAPLTLALLSLLTLPAAAQIETTGADNPLDRRVAIHMREVALRDAVDRIAVLAGIRVSYSVESVTLDQRVSLARDNASEALLGTSDGMFATAQWITPCFR